MMQIKSGWLEHVRQVPTTMFDARPSGFDISLIVIHCIALPPNTFGTPYIDDLFTFTLNKDAHPYFKDLYNVKLSTHLFINRHGLITQYVSFLDRAYHAGRSSYHGAPECNDYSVGIELEGSVETCFTDIQYQKLGEVIVALQHAYPSIQNNIATHSQIAPGRKNDPGPFFDFKKVKTINKDNL